MAGKLISEIFQSKPFELVEEEAVLNIARTADVLGQAMADFLKEFGLTPSQYNVLRILRGAGERGATCTQIGERMVNRDPDITRLLDRLEGRGLAVRQRAKEDRRVVWTTISEDGLRLIAAIDEPLRAFVRRRLEGVEGLSGLIDRLEQIRGRFAERKKENL